MLDRAPNTPLAYLTYFRGVTRTPTNLFNVCWGSWPCPSFLLLSGLVKSLFFLNCRSSHRRCSIKENILKSFANFTGKHLCQSLYFDKVPSLRPVILLKKRLWQIFFLWILGNFLENLFYRPLLNDCFCNCFGTLRFWMTVWGQGIPSARYSNLVKSFSLRSLLFYKAQNYNSIVDDCHIYIILWWIHKMYEILHKRFNKQ